MVEAQIRNPAHGNFATERQKFSEKLSDEEMGNLLASIGNSEAKALTLLVLADGCILPDKAIQTKLSKLQGPSPAWRPVSKYCETTLAPIGLVAKEYIEPEGNLWGYQITDYGKRIGIPLAGLLLDFSSKYNPALYDLFGRTQSVSKEESRDASTGAIKFKKRSPMTRLRIFWELLTAELPVRQLDLASQVAHPSMMGHHLMDLGRNGVIQYESMESSKPIAYFRLSDVKPEGEPTPEGTAVTMTQKIYNIFQNSSDAWVAREQVRDLYLNLFPEKKSLSQKTLLTAISRILTHLTRQGYLQRKKFGDFTQSEVDLSDVQRTTLNELVKILDRFQQGDRKLLEEGRLKAAMILSDPIQTYRLMEKSRNASPEANKNETRVTAAKALDIIGKSSGIDTKGVRRTLEQLGQKLTMIRVSRIITRLNRQGLIEKTEEKGYHWKLK